MFRSRKTINNDSITQLNNFIKENSKARKKHKKTRLLVYSFILIATICIGAVSYVLYEQNTSVAKADRIVKRDFNKKTTSITKYATLDDMNKLAKYARNIKDSDHQAYYSKLAAVGKAAVQDEGRYQYLRTGTGMYSRHLTSDLLDKDMDILTDNQKLANRLPDYYSKSYWRYMNLIGKAQVVDYLNEHVNALFDENGHVKKDISFDQVDQLLFYESQYKEKFQRSADDYKRLTDARKVLEKRQKKREKKEAKARKKAEAKKRKEDSIKASMQRESESMKAMQQSIADANKKQNSTSTKASNATSITTVPSSSSGSSYTSSGSSTTSNSSSAISSSSSYDSESMDSDISSILDNN